MILRASAALAAVCVLSFAPMADACGGFFCDVPPAPDPNNPDLTLPVYQTGELVLFVAGEDEVEAHIQIQYAGEADQFAWVVPVQAPPEIDFGTDEAFFALASLTTPALRTQTADQRCPICFECPEEDYYDSSGDGWADDTDDHGGRVGGGGCGCGGSADISAAAGDGDVDTDSDVDADGDGDTDADADWGTDSDVPPEPPVQVLDTGTVGPFETVTLEATDSSALTDWLAENGYVIPETAYPLIDSYVSAGMYFVGLKLAKEADTGDIRPIIFRMRGTEVRPCVPLRLTAISAAEEMPVTVWVLGDARAVSTNYAEVVQNDVQTHLLGADWTLSRALDEAGGRGFVVDYADDSAPLRAAIDPSRYNTAVLEGISDPVDFLDEMIRQGFVQSRLVLDLLRRFIPKPDSVTADDATFYQCLECGEGYYGDYFDAGCTECYEDDIADQPFDPEAFAAALEQEIVRPLRALYDRMASTPVLTGMRSRLSPFEMTEDPEFALRPDLPPVAPMGPAQSVRTCQGTILGADDYTELTTPEGLTARWSAEDPFLPAEIEGLPSALRIFRRDGSEDELVLDVTDAIQGALPVDFPQAVPPGEDFRCPCGRSDGGFSYAGIGAGTRASSGSRCSAPGPRSFGEGVVPALVALAALGTRRRRPRR